MVQGEDGFVISPVPLNFDASLTVVPGLVSEPSRWWNFIRNRFGPTWRNFWIFAGVGAGIFVTGALMTPTKPSVESSDGDEDKHQRV